MIASIHPLIEAQIARIDLPASAGRVQSRCGFKSVIASIAAKSSSTLFRMAIGNPAHFAVDIALSAVSDP